MMSKDEWKGYGVGTKGRCKERECVCVCVTYSVCVGFPAGEYAHVLAAKVLTFKVFCHRE